MRGFSDMNTRRVVMRTEPFDTACAGVSQILRSRWPSSPSLASAHSLSSVYLWYSPREHPVSVNSYAGRIGPKITDSSDLASLGALAAGQGAGQQLFGD